MRYLKILLAWLGIVGLSATPTPSAAQSADLQAEAERACDRALAINTIEALEEYLRKYPNASTACRTLALNALQGFSPSGPGFPGIVVGGSYGG